MARASGRIFSGPRTNGLSEAKHLRAAALQQFRKHDFTLLPVSALPGIVKTDPKNGRGTLEDLETEMPFAGRGIGET